ncbi:hypothetical protein [Bythopirellula polymerisocia]|uniref:Uncharacterized protein n=1 Tax=Bythopirellula polymerisocia TaxID=2528003 RepID=A0A5C6CRV8_9BACT|nr:hypothetical protein [Bythopirellula polymerisocia]TWU25539.1 hypothetical protein Pla144_27460 [Bythopirellula polymerisocia]
MNRKWKWLADLSHGVYLPCYPRSPRRIVAPERLESRNAPGVMLPLFGSLFEAELNQSDEIQSSATHNRVLLQYYRTEAVAPPLAGQLNEPIFIEKILAEDKSLEYAPTVSVPESHVPYEIAVLDAAFDSISSEFGSSLNELPPLLTQPVIMDPASTHNWVDLVPLPVTEANLPDVGAGSIAVRTQTGSIRSEVSAPLPAPKDVVVPVAPPMIQPVITDPASEYNSPSFEGESLVAPLAPAAPPLMIQPVITGPASVYNAPGFTGELLAEPVAPEAPPLMIQPVISDPTSEYNAPGFTGEVLAEKVAPAVQQITAEVLII